MRCGSSSSLDNIKYTVLGQHTGKSIVKRSTFIAHVTSADSFIDAKDFIEKVSDLKSRHNCWGWVGKHTQRSNDDGEPSGTAGRPILNAITSEGLINVVIVVTRYKTNQAPLLGAGGLIRAYGGTASMVLKEMDKVLIVDKQTIRICYPVHVSNKVHHVMYKYENSLIGKGKLEKKKETYSEDGVEVVLLVSIEESYTDLFLNELMLSANEVQAISIERTTK